MIVEFNSLFNCLKKAHTGNPVLEHCFLTNFPVSIYIYIFIYKIHINLPDMSQLPISPFPKRGHQGPETFLALSADKQTGEGDIKGATGVLGESPKCSN